MTFGRTLTLVRHALVEPHPSLPQRSWSLSAEGVRRARLLARSLEVVAPFSVVTSPASCATETAAMIAASKERGVEVNRALREISRPATRWVQSQREIDDAARMLFARPAIVRFGSETPDAAHARFSAAISEIMARREGNVVVVSHATVIALYVARANNIDAFSLWKRLRSPSSVTLSWPDLSPTMLVERYD